MIDITKKYKTRDGREVRIYAVDGNGLYPVHGAVKYGDGWSSAVWTKDGLHDYEDGLSSLNLVEMKPRIQREVWVNVFEHCCGIHNTKGQAGYFDKHGSSIRIACVKFVIDCEEGHGL
jgi:hypothetical protein